MTNNRISDKDLTATLNSNELTYDSGKTITVTVGSVAIDYETLF